MQKVLGIVGIVGIKFKFNDLKIHLLGIYWELLGNCLGIYLKTTNYKIKWK